MINLENRVAELEVKVEKLESENKKLKEEIVEATVERITELNAALQQFQRDTVDSCVHNIVQLLEQKKII